MGSRNGVVDVKREIERDEEEDDYDPQYTLFFQTLKPWGNAHKLELERGNATVIIKFEDEDEDEDILQRRRKVPRPNLEPCGNAGVPQLARGKDIKITKPVSRYSLRARRSDGGVSLHEEMKSPEFDCGQLQEHRVPCRYIGESSKSVKRNTRYASGRDVPSPRVADKPDQNGKHKNLRGFSRGSGVEFRVVNERSADLDVGKKSQRQGRVVSGNISRRRGRMNGNPPVVNEVSDGLYKGKRQREGHAVSRKRGRLNDNPPEQRSNGEKGKESQRQGRVVSGNLSRRRGRINGNPPVVNEVSDGLYKGKRQREGHVVSRKRGRLNDNPPEQHSNGEKGKEGVQTLDRDKIQKEYYMFLSGLMIKTGHFIVYEGKDGKQCRYGKSKTDGSRSDPVTGVANERSDGLGKGKSQRQGRVVYGNLSRRRGRLNRNPPMVNQGSDGPCVSRRRRRLNGNPPGQRSNEETGKERVQRQTLDRDKIDKTYYMFISGLINPGHVLVYETKDGKQCRYDKKTDEGRSDPDTGGSPRRPPSSGRMTPEPSSKRVAPSDKRVPSNQSVEGLGSEFRQRVMDILLKPYDQKEYADLLKEAKRRTPHVRSRELRGGRIFEYPDESKLGKSYLDHHRDLEKMLRAVQRDDPHKALQLLRGFFSYMQHLCMEEGIFKPWNDELWLEAMNRNTS